MASWNRLCPFPALLSLRHTTRSGPYGELCPLARSPFYWETLVKPQCNCTAEAAYGFLVE